MPLPAAGAVATGKGGARDYGAGVELADKACTLRTPKACAVAARLRRSPPRVTCETIEACEPLCDEKIPRACVKLAELETAADAEFGCRNSFSAREAACTLGDGASCVARGNEAIAADEAGRWYERGCTAKHAPACVLLHATVLDDKNADKQDAASAEKFLASACRRRDALACAFHADRLGFDRSDQAARLWKSSCAAGHGLACARYASWLEDWLPPGGVSGIGDGTPQPLHPGVVKRQTQARSFYEKACKLATRCRAGGWTTLARGYRPSHRRAAATTPGCASDAPRGDAP